VQRTLILATVLATIVGVGMVAASSSPNLAKCTKVGSPDSDALKGTARKDVICALAGNDYISGGGGPDRLFGDAGRDTIVGGKGADIISGGKGRGRLFSVDGLANDRVNGGLGEDFCYADPGDILRNCEHQFRRASVETVNALGRAFDGGLGLVDELVSITPTVTIPPPVTVTIVTTVTKLIPFPACDPPPNIPPAPCP
jgi:Ca2+-binding RTX toxin-like protein